jgi:hypothetical protein
MDQPHSEKELLQIRLAKLAADFDCVVHIASHDLRDPLRQALIYNDELAQNLHGEDKLKLQEVNQLLENLLTKIAILRDYFYIVNDKSTFAPHDLNVVINEVVSELDAKINAASGEIKITSLPTIYGNRKQLKRIFSELIDNAIKFRAKDVALKISISVSEERKFWHFMVADSGIGLDTIYRELVFVLFQKLDNESQDSGYGAGLAFAKKNVENHGGEIWYESDGHSGTIFHFTLKK